MDNNLFDVDENLTSDRTVMIDEQKNKWKSTEDYLKNNPGVSIEELERIEKELDSSAKLLEDLPDLSSSTVIPQMDGGQANSLGGRQKVVIPFGVRPSSSNVSSSNNGVNGNIGNYSGFADKLMISLLAGFGLGAVATAVYIFVNLGKVTFTL